MTDDPQTYDYSQPTLVCDVVMKGGITSGVVYPHALCELARTYRFANVGGTSAGAIAAAAAAAAEHGRARGGFEKLAALPAWVGGGDNLFRLFQPQPGTRPYFRLFTAGMGRTGLGKWLRVKLAALRGFPVAALLGVAPGLALVVLAIVSGSGALAVAAVLAGIVLAVLGLILALGAQLAVGLPRALGRNDFGLCSGLPSGDGGAPALTPWLADLIDDLAGTDDGGPLTFGDLRAKGVELHVMTTNVTHRRPHRMPWSSRELLRPGRAPPSLSRADRRLDGGAPARARLGTCGRAGTTSARRARATTSVPASGRPAGRRRSTDEPQLPLAHQRDSTSCAGHDPAAHAEGGRSGRGGDGAGGEHRRRDVLVLGRRDREQLSRPLLRRTAADAADVRDRPGRLPSRSSAAPGGGRKRLPALLERRRPARQLAPARPEARPRPPRRVRERHRPHDAEPRRRLAHAPAGIPRPHRPRPHGARRGRDEPHDARGGDRRPDASRPGGRTGARRAVRGDPGTAPGLSWDNHRWVRYRSTLAALTELLEPLAAAWREDPAGLRSYRELLERTETEGPNGYRFDSEAQRRLAASLTDLLAQVGEQAAAGPGDVTEGAPRPEPVARIVPGR